MADYYTRNLTFQSNDLGIDTAFVLTFDDSKDNRTYRTLFPTAFKVTRFGATGNYLFKVLFNSKFGFTRAQISGEVVVPATTYIPIDPGQQTTLSKIGTQLPLYSFSTPTAITPPSTQLEAVNGTSGREDIGLGFFERPDDAPTQVLVFEGVGAGSSVREVFIPILRGYMTSDIPERKVLRRQIESPIIFREDLINLPENTTWRVTYNQGSGVFTITRV